MFKLQEKRGNYARLLDVYKLQDLAENLLNYKTY